MKGAPIRGPRFSGVADNISGFSGSDLDSSSSNLQNNSNGRNQSSGPRGREPVRRSEPTNNSTQKVSSNKKGRTSLDIKGKKTGTEKRNRNSISSSRSKLNSKDNSQDETRESAKDPNDKEFDQSGDV